MWFINFHLNRITNTVDEAECGYLILGRFSEEAVRTVAAELEFDLIVY